jgi:Nif-specific regulatory protein
MIKLLKDVELLAPLDLSLLITGDNGTGKSQLAKVVHMNSSRRQGPFVDVNCAALQDTLLENELFGSEKGAFTGADHARAGKVAAANGGTLFLDEIGELSMTAQAKLLQLLQNKEYHTVGGTRLLRADVRVIAATNADLRQRMNEKRFRDDLFFRLEVLPLRVPNLRERREDIGELAAYFCARTLQRHVLSPVIELSPGALAELRAREWPGNIRQLENVVQAGVIRACGKRAAQVEARHLFPETYDEAPDSEPRALSFQEETRRFQRALLQRTLRETDWNVTATARRLDLARAHVYNLVNSFGLTIDRNRN